VPRIPPWTPPFNKWSANQPGTTYFLPVDELSQFYINIMLSAFSEEFGYFMLDERNGFKPAGIGQFALSKGGRLYNDPQISRIGTIGVLETWISEFVAIEMGGMLQNLVLMSQALGLGGFPHFAAHPFGWMQVLGFRMQQAVLAYVEYKYAPGAGTLSDGGAASAWRDGTAVQAGIPRPSDRTIAATIAYYDYVYRSYGRFSASNRPFRTVLAYHAHHLDTAFYDAFYQDGR
jgi:hypothetical protein